MIDVHVHTRFSFDSKETPESYIEILKSRNIPVIGFSEHYDYDAYLDGDKSVTLADLDSYFSYIEKMRAQNPQLQILCGIELGYRREAVTKYNKLLADYPFDYAINSVHTLKGRGDCFHDEFFKGKSLKESYNDYFNAVYESVTSDIGYQIVGHIGYVARYRCGDGAKIEYGCHKHIIDEILKEIIKRDKCLEINTSSGKGGNEFLPDKDVILRYLELGGKKLSYGSDAHRAEDFLRKSEDLNAFLKSLGVSSLYYYKERKAVPYTI